MATSQPFLRSSRCGTAWIFRFGFDHAAPGVMSTPAAFIAPSFLTKTTTTIKTSYFNAPSHRSFSTTLVAFAHKPYYQKTTRKNLKYAAGMSKKPRVSFMTKDVLGEAESSYQKLFTIMTRDGRQVERQEQARGEKVEREASEEQASVSNEKAIDSASGDDKGGELTEINIETRLAEYRERTLDLVMNRVEEALRAPDPQSGQTLAFSEETREKLGQICGFLLDEGAIYPPDMIKFMTTEPNPAGFCALPVDRLIEGELSAWIERLMVISFVSNAQCTVGPQYIRVPLVHFLYQGYCKK